MKALTIYQPWASLVMIGAKPHEFRGWPLTEIQPFDSPIPRRGMQGFWEW